MASSPGSPRCAYCVMKITDQFQTMKGELRGTWAGPANEGSDWQQTGDVIASMVYEDTSSAATPKPHYPTVVRFHSDDGGRTAASQTTT